MSVGATRSLDQTVLRPPVIKIIRQMTLIHNTHAVYLREKKCTQNETVVLRIIYIKNIKNVPKTPAAGGGTDSSVKISEN